MDWGGFRLDDSVMKVDLGKIKCSFHKLNHVIGVDLSWITLGWGGFYINYSTYITYES